MTPRVKFHNDVDHTLDRLMVGVVGRINVLTMDTK